MIDTPQIVQTTARLAAVIHLTIPRSEIRSAMGPGIAEVMAAVKAQGIGPAGPWFTHHLKMDPATFDFEICVPVTAPVTPTGRVKPGVFPAVKVARTIYRGDYEGLGGAWGEFKAWIAANGHAMGPDLFECYPVGPESSANPADWRTELSQPLIPAAVANLRFSDVKEIDVDKLLDHYRFGFWSDQRTRQDVVRMLEHTSMVVSAWDGELLVAFARLLTDFTYRATIWDVIVRPEYQGRGVGNGLMKYILGHPRLQTVSFFWLSTRDKHTFYEQLGFTRDSTDSMTLRR